MKISPLNKINLNYHLPNLNSIDKSFVPVNHICIHEDATIFNDMVIPFGAKDIEEKNTFVIDEIFHNMIHILMSKENKDKQIIICGSPKVKKMFGRKLEDRIKKELTY
jgi:hypothetical protein